MMISLFCKILIIFAQIGTTHGIVGTMVEIDINMVIKNETNL